MHTALLVGKTPSCTQLDTRGTVHVFTGLFFSIHRGYRFPTGCSSGRGALRQCEVQAEPEPRCPTCHVAAYGKSHSRKPGLQEDAAELRWLVGFLPLKILPGSLPLGSSERRAGNKLDLCAHTDFNWSQGLAFPPRQLLRSFFPSLPCLRT